MMRYWYKIALNKITQKTTQRDEMRENKVRDVEDVSLVRR